MIVERKYYVGYQYIDPGYRIRNSAILGMFEDLAVLHGAMVGEDIRTSDSAWLLTGYLVKIIKRPIFNETVTVRTWSRRTLGFSACREFEIIGEDGQIMVTAMSEWAHVSRDGSGFSKLTPELSAAYESEPDRTGFPDVKRLPRTHATLDKSENAIASADFTVGRSLIDMNRHLNNVRYIELAEEVLSGNVPEEYSADSFFISYKKEVVYGGTVRCELYETDGEYEIAFVGEDGTLHATVILHK